MRKFIYLLIPIILVILIVFGVIKVFILPDGGKGALQVTSKPFSKVYLDGTYIGNTPLCRCEGPDMIRSGDHTLRLVPLDNNFREFQDKVTITKGVLTVVDRKFGRGATSEGSTISLQPLANKNSTELLVITIPEKADVFLDAEEKGKTPFHMTDLTVSDHTLRLKKSGYIDKTIRIRTPLGYKLIATAYLGISETDSNLTPTPTASISATLSPSVSPKVTPKISAKVLILATPNGFLRVRENASVDSLEISRVNSGELFNLVEEAEGWYKIRLTDGTEGWVSAQYAQKQ